MTSESGKQNKKVKGADTLLEWGPQNGGVHTGVPSVFSQFLADEVDVIPGMCLGSQLILRS